MNSRTRRVALYAIAGIAILASANALAHSYAGLFDWAVHHRLSGWQAMSWPAEIDVFLAVGELALYVAYLDGWPARQRIWPWATALIGLAVSVAGNIGHIQAEPGQPVIVADRLTAATSPIAAFAGLSVGLLVLKMTRQRASSRPQGSDASATLMLAARAPGTGRVLSSQRACGHVVNRARRPARARRARRRRRESWVAARRYCHLPARRRSGRTAQPAGPGPAVAPAWAPVPQRSPPPDRAERLAGHGQGGMSSQANGPAAEPPAQQSAGSQTRKVDGVQDVEAIATRLREACSLPELLAVSFEAFEAIRVFARRSEDMVPWLFAAFMMAADAAVNGREAITIAPSLSPAPARHATRQPAGRRCRDQDDHRRHSGAGRAAR